MQTLLRWLHRLWLVLVYAPLALMLTIIAFLLVAMLQPVAGERRAGAWVAPYWARTLARLLPMRVRVHRSAPLDTGRAYVLVANHQSQLDILALYGWLGMDLRWVVKRELRNIPLIGWGCRVIGHVFVDRGNRDAAIRSINDAVRKLEPSECLLFFPEGTRSRSGRLLPFKSGAFRTALQQQLPVLPISISGTYPMMPPGHRLPSYGSADIMIHAPIETRGLAASGEQARQLLEQARACIADGLSRLERSCAY